MRAFLDLERFELQQQRVLLRFSGGTIDQSDRFGFAGGGRFPRVRQALRFAAGFLGDAVSLQLDALIFFLLRFELRFVKQPSIAAQ